MNNQSKTDINACLADLADWKKIVEKRLWIIFQNERKSIGNTSPSLREGFHQLEEFTMRSASKRIRAYLVKLGYQSSGKRPPKKLADISAAVELIHSYLLIHDDIIDRDELRRGGPTVHEAFRRKLSGSTQERRFRGVALAILIGDYASNLAYKVFIKSTWPDDKIRQSLDEVYKNLLEYTLVGQFMDVEQTWQRRVNSKLVEKIAEYKTAYYTFNGPLQIGAVFAGASQSTRRTLTKYSVPVGIGFQLVDDIIGFIGSKESGKSSNDIKEGKISAIILKARKYLKTKDRKKLDLLIKKEHRNTREVDQIRSLVGQTPALSFIKKQAINLAQKGKTTIARSRHINKKCANMLSVISDLSVNRNR
ncbi:MAG: polyprenyl synthetase family protein [bacterium]